MENCHGTVQLPCLRGKDVLQRSLRVPQAKSGGTADPTDRGDLLQYSTVVDHMPESHRKYLQWNGERFLSWAEKVGPHTKAVIQGMLSSRKVEQQSYRACMALLKLGDKYSLTRLESACGRALQYTATPNYKTIQMILKTGSDLLKEEPETKGESYAFTRGAAYYGGGEGKC